MASALVAINHSLQHDERYVYGLLQYIALVKSHLYRVQS